MAVQNPAIFLQAGSHPAEDVRRFISTLMGDRHGIVAPGDLAVAQTATASMAVDVAGGRAFIEGDENTYQGLYFVENRGATNLAVAPADATNSRFDLVVARVKDASYSGTASAWSLEVITGTAAATPAEPAVPANALVLARITVAAGATTITNADIVDRRLDTLGQSQVTTLGGVLVTTAADLPATGDFVGHHAFETDTARTRVWDGTRWRYAGDRTLAADAATRAALTAYEGLRALETTTGREWVYQSGAWAVTDGATPGIRVTKSGGQSIALNTWTAVTWDVQPTARLSNADMFSTSQPTRLTARVTGRYRVRAGVNGATHLQVRHNSAGNNAAGTMLGSDTAGEPAFRNAAADEVWMEAGDHVEVFALRSTTAGDVGTLFGYIAHFSLSYVGPN